MSFLLASCVKSLKELSVTLSAVVGVRLVVERDLFEVGSERIQTKILPHVAPERKRILRVPKCPAADLK